jgi:hypothetical protein
MPTPRRIAALLAVALVAVAVAGCSLLRLPNPSPVAPPDAELAAHHQAWMSRGIASYAWTISFGCECAINGPVEVTVTGGVATAATMDGRPVPLAQVSAFPLTVDAVYAKARAALDGGGTITPAWGSGGLPTAILIDPIPNAVDDELSVTVNAFVPAP